MSATSLGDLVEVVRTVGRERAQIMDKAKEALRKGDDATAVELLRGLLGVEPPPIGQ